MWLKSLGLKHIRGFAESDIQFSREINLLVGRNNSGKSTLLRAIFLLQPPIGQNTEPFEFSNKFRRHGSTKSKIELELADIEPRQLLSHPNPASNKLTRKVQFILNQSQGLQALIQSGQQEGQYDPFQPSLCNQIEPNNFIYPYFSHRKPSHFEAQISQHHANSIEETLLHLTSKVDRLCNPDSPDYDLFRRTCERALGFTISCGHYGNGKQPGLTLKDRGFIPLNAMGEGTVNVLGFLAHLCPADGKLFLIEELENDLHPAALKSLLELIEHKSKNNQFFISTHSNIVVRYLGGLPGTKVLSLQMTLEDATRIPNSVCNEVPPDAESRIRLLEDLGYNLFDFYQWHGWLILEESTAERLIRDFLIPQFFPDLRLKLATISARGAHRVESLFEDLNRLFTFVHLMRHYEHRAWVMVDNEPEGQNAIARLRKTFVTWPQEHFCLFEQANIESYYPARFKDEVARVIALKHGREKQEAKGLLIETVMNWAKGDIETAKAEFKESAAEVLGLLKRIPSQLKED